MLKYQKSTDARKHWSEILDLAIRNKPVFLTRTRDAVALFNLEMLKETLSAYIFNATLYPENDGSVTISLSEIDLVENGKDLEDALDKMASSLIEYAEEYYDNFEYWYSSPNRKKHFPYILKILILNNKKDICNIILIKK